MEILQFVPFWQGSGVHGLHFGFEPESNLEYYRKVCVSLNAVGVCEICASCVWAVSGLTFCTADSRRHDPPFLETGSWKLEVGS